MSSDDLERALQENLKLRSELAANVAKATGSGIAFRLGWVVYFACLVLVVLWAVGMFALLASTKDTIPEMIGEVMREPLAHLIWFGLPTVAIYGLGRAFRYVLSGE